MNKLDIRCNNMMRQFLIQCVRLYRYCISPLFPPSCRFQPSCSSYMEQALGKYGVIRGLLHGGKRFLRCHPFCEGGIDPLP